jgi:phosphodiesterase/alkaline phosphatase D-like protein
VTSSGREGAPEPASVATEPASVATAFVCDAITSEGIADKYGDGALAFPADTVVMNNNPHIKFSNQQYKGYGVVEAKADEPLVQYKAPESTQTAASDLFTLKRFRVARGTPEVELLA